MFQCPVCGDPGLNEVPRRHGSPSYEICRSCDFQFGYDDDSEGITYDQWREQWVRGSMPWFSRAVRPPPDWDPASHLRRLLAQRQDDAADKDGDA